MRLDDTIAAIATPLQPSGLGVIRVSGKRAVPLVEHLFKSSSEKISGLQKMTSDHEHDGETTILKL